MKDTQKSDESTTATGNTFEGFTAEERGARARPACSCPWPAAR